jgi:ATP-dependent RNA helicase RhlE
METFESLGLTRQFLDAVQDSGFETPSPIQQKAIPAIRSGQHLIGIAQTGTGKTAAYLLPILQNLKFAQGEDARCLIIVPTKELVLQVTEQIQALAKYTDLRFVGIYGGVGRKAQVAAIEKGVDLIVSTPRRLLELYEEEGVVVKNIQILILDEADRMLDMGFMPQINLLLDILPRKKQNLLFSATFSPRVEELSWNFMDFPVKIEITPEATPVETVTQAAYVLPNIQTKLNLLADFLKNEEDFRRVIIFTRSKQSANTVYEFLRGHARGEVRLIHSNKSQNTRINSFNEFRDGYIRMLVATDVMARGVDIRMVTHVFNFDVPVLIEDYVHRIGRTGRASQLGSAISFITKADAPVWERIEQKIRMQVPISPIPEHIVITETPFEEQQEMNLVLDEYKRKQDPTFLGAFHEKKDYKLKQSEKARKKVPIHTNKARTSYKSSNTSKPKTSKYKR